MCNSNYYAFQDDGRAILNMLPLKKKKLNIQRNKIMVSNPNTSSEIDRETVEIVAEFILGAPKSLLMVIAAMKLKDAYSLEGKL